MRLSQRRLPKTEGYPCTRREVKSTFDRTDVKWISLGSIRHFEFDKRSIHRPKIRGVVVASVTYSPQREAHVCIYVVRKADARGNQGPNMNEPPTVEGNMQASVWKKRIIVAGDPAGLKSLARLLLWLADLDQESISRLPKGERAHVHLYGDSQLSADSSELELCRLDAKSTGEFPRGFTATDKGIRGVAYPEWFVNGPGA